MGYVKMREIYCFIGEIHYYCTNLRSINISLYWLLNLNHYSKMFITVLDL
jgi:hypothetical protein